MIKRILSIVLILMIFISLSACYDSREIDDMAYAMAIGIDKGKNHELRITVQFATPKSGGSEGGEGKGSSEGIVHTTVEAPSIYGAINTINGYITKQVNMSHAKLIVFSKEISEEGIYKYINAFVRGREFRGNMYLAVSRTTAEEFIKASTPTLQANSSRMLEGLFNTYKYAGSSYSTQLYEFYNQMQSNSVQAVASLVGVGKYEDINEVDITKSTYKEKGQDKAEAGDYKAGDIPKTFETKTEIMGLAVFNGNKMVGELDGKQASIYLVITGKFKSANLSLPDPKVPNNNVVLNIKQSRMPESKVDIKGEKPKINLNIKLEADILAIQSGYNYENAEISKELEAYYEDEIKKMIVQFLNETTKKFKADICGFGKYAKIKFLTWQEWENYNWLKKYSESEFAINIDLKIRRPGLIIKSVPAASSSGSE